MPAVTLDKPRSTPFVPSRLRIVNFCPDVEAVLRATAEVLTVTLAALTATAYSPVTVQNAAARRTTSAMRAEARTVFLPSVNCVPVNPISTSTPRFSAR